ncbi:hypothetical protein [Alsobacter sp. SYSU BS001988]
MSGILDPRLQQNCGGDEVYADSDPPEFVAEEREIRRRLMRPRRSGRVMAVVSVGVAAASAVLAVAILGMGSPVGPSTPRGADPAPGAQTSSGPQAPARSAAAPADAARIVAAVERTPAPVEPLPAKPIPVEEPTPAARPLASAEPAVVKVDIVAEPPAAIAAAPPIPASPPAPPVPASPPAPPSPLAAVAPEPQPAAKPAKEEAASVRQEPSRPDEALLAIEQPQTGAIRRKADEARPAVTLPSGEAAKLVALSRIKIKQGDIAGARRLLERAAAADDPEALFALAETYDAAVLARWGVIGVKPDGAMAKSLYGKAASKGGGAAQRALAAIATAERQEQTGSNRVAP